MCAMMEKLRMWAGSMQVEHEIIACGRALPLVERHESLRIVGTGVVRAGTNQPVVRVLLQHVRRPPGHAADREDRRVEIDGNAERVEGGRGIEVHVRVQLLLRLY